MSTSQDLFELDKEARFATSTLRELQRQVAVLRARLSVPCDSAESGGSTSGEDEFDEVISNQIAAQDQIWYDVQRVLVWTPLVNTLTQERMCRFGSPCWRPRCWFQHGRGDLWKMSRRRMERRN